jgi:uncharacterized membrane protein YcaP (DUF421 family)
MFDHIDWNSLFTDHVPVLEIIVRGTLMYLGLVLMLRFVPNRQMGNLGVTDVLLIVLLADAAQNGMAGSYSSIPDGLLLVATIAFWDFVLDWLSFHFRFFNWLLSRKEVPLIRNGRMLKQNMRQQMISEDELESYLREKGIDDVSKVKTACIESSGEISVVPYDQKLKVNTKTKKAV